MNIVIGALPKGKRSLIPLSLDFNGLRGTVKEKYGKNYEVIGFRRDKKGRGQILIGKIVKDRKGGVRIEKEKGKEIQVRL